MLNQESRRLFRKGVLYNTEVASLAKNETYVKNRVNELYTDDDMEALHARIASMLREIAAAKSHQALLALNTE